MTRKQLAREAFWRGIMNADERLTEKMLEEFAFVEFEAWWAELYRRGLETER